MEQGPAVRLAEGFYTYTCTCACTCACTVYRPSFSGFHGCLCSGVCILPDELVSAVSALCHGFSGFVTHETRCCGPELWIRCGGGGLCRPALRSLDLHASANERELRQLIAHVPPQLPLHGEPSSERCGSESASDTSSCTARRTDRPFPTAIAADCPRKQPWCCSRHPCHA